MIDAVIVAAGKSSRMRRDIPKPFILIESRPIIWFSLKSFDNFEHTGNIVIVVSSENIDLAYETGDKYFRDIKKKVEIIEGGDCRQESVYNALKFLNKNNCSEYVSIHDGARPFITKQIILELYENVKKYDATAPALSVIDTVKKIDENNFITEHIKRSSLCRIQTPQTFNFKKLFNAYNLVKNDLESFTDDTEIYGVTEKKIKLVEGDKNLFKITYNEDIQKALEIFEREYKFWG